MISSKGKTNWILPHAVLLISLLLSKGTDTARSRLYVKMSFSLLFGRCHLNTRITFCPEAVNEMLKWATCQRSQESERRAFSGPCLREQGGRLVALVQRRRADALSQDTHKRNVKWNIVFNHSFTDLPCCYMSRLFRSALDFSKIN